MKHLAIEKLLTALRAKFDRAVTPYGTSAEEKDGTGFRIEGIPATFSAICLPSIPIGQYDIQIESFPPGNYVYQDLVDLGQFIDLVEEYRRPMSEWRQERWNGT